MTTIGIIAEYNPFHKGHASQIDKIRNKYPNATILIVMSGGFVQRGEPALFNKFTRAKYALSCGADLVFELPSYFALSSAEHFASGAIKLLHALSVSTIAFGSEHDDPIALKQVASLLNSIHMQQAALSHIKKGTSYSSAVRQALKDSYPKFTPLINSPNSLLAIEYIRAIQRQNFDISILPILRESNHHTTTLNPSLPSGSAIRESIKEILLNSSKSFENTIGQAFPSNIAEEVHRTLHNHSFLNYSRYDDLILYKLRTSSLDELRTTESMAEGLEHLWLDHCHLDSVDSLLHSIKSKRYPFARLRRIAANLVLQRTSTMCNTAYKRGPSYGRLLGFSDRGRNWLKNTKTDIPIINKLSPFYKLADPYTRMLLDGDILATNIQSLCFQNINDRIGNTDFTYSPLYYKNIPS